MKPIRYILLTLVAILALAHIPAYADSASGGSQYRHLYRFLDTNGDGTGSMNQAVNGSITPVEFRFQPLAGEIVQVERVIIHLEDNGTFQAGGYGSISAVALTNGIRLEKRRTVDDSISTDYMAGSPVASNGDWSRISYDMTYHSFGGGSTNKFIAVRFTFSKSGQPVILNADTYIVAVISDDISTVISQTMNVQGWYIKSP